MTFMSLCVLSHPEDATDAVLERYNLGAEKIQDLDSYARACGPYALASWAERYGLPVFRVDSCWVRIPVNGAQVAFFVKEALKDGPTLVSAIDPVGRYLIEAEEY